MSRSDVKRKTAPIIIDAVRIKNRYFDVSVVKEKVLRLLTVVTTIAAAILLLSICFPFWS